MLVVCFKNDLIIIGLVLPSAYLSIQFSEQLWLGQVNETVQIAHVLYSTHSLAGREDHYLCVNMSEVNPRHTFFGHSNIQWHKVILSTAFGLYATMLCYKLMLHLVYTQHSIVVDEGASICVISLSFIFIYSVFVCQRKRISYIFTLDLFWLHEKKKQKTTKEKKLIPQKGHSWLEYLNSSSLRGEYDTMKHLKSKK